jgi:energy-coupling factor transporter ATP-binding protein EcfA2
MQKLAVPQRTVLETILEWSKDRPLWQRDALRRIIANGRLTDADIGELVDLCKQGKGAPAGALKAVPLEKANLPANPGQTAAISLVSIADVTGVNNLAAGQTLGFQPNGITIIYGDNGAGKSGYTRILKRACRARHSGNIQPNVYADQPPKHVGASIAYVIGSTPQPLEPWQNAANPHATLSAVSVFDSDCASVHIREKNEVAFRPFGLDVPDELAAACLAVKDSLAAEQKQLEKTRNPIFAAPTWKGITMVGKALAALSAGTDAQKVEALAALSSDESARLERLREDLSKNPTKAAAEQTVKAENVMRLIAAVNGLAVGTADAKLLGAAVLTKDALSKRDAARLAAEKAFTGEPLAVGFRSTLLNRDCIPRTAVPAVGRRRALRALPAAAGS